MPDISDALEKVASAISEIPNLIGAIDLPELAEIRAALWEIKHELEAFPKHAGYPALPGDEVWKIRLYTDDIGFEVVRYPVFWWDQHLVPVCARSFTGDPHIYFRGGIVSDAALGLGIQGLHRILYSICGYSKKQVLKCLNNHFNIWRAAMNNKADPIELSQELWDEIDSVYPLLRLRLSEAIGWSETHPEAENSDKWRVPEFLELCARMEQAPEVAPLHKRVFRTLFRRFTATATTNSQA